MIEKVRGLNRRDTARMLQIDGKTLRNWTGRGLIKASVWVSPGGRHYVAYAADEVDRMRAELSG